MKCAYTESSFKTLHTQWETFFMFCEYFKLDSLPVTVDILCLYAQFLHRSFRSVNSIKNYLSGIKMLHTTHNIGFRLSAKKYDSAKFFIKGYVTSKKTHVIRKAMPITP